MMTAGLVGSLLVVGIIMFCSQAVVGLVRRREQDDLVTGHEPFVTIITPMYNEGSSIRQTIRSLVAQDYSTDKLQVIVVDDCSTDDSYQHALDEARKYRHVRVLRNDKNVGKRYSIIRAVRESTAEIIVSVDSDVIVEPDAVRELVARFTSPAIAAVGGRVDIRNKRDNWLTRMQAVKYYFGYHFLKNIERSFRTVMCLSGCLTAYRRSVLLELEPILAQRNILGVSIKYGEDRFLTRQIIKAGYQTTMTMDAVCRTVAPNNLDAYFAQQVRWRRSNIVDYIGGLSHVWRLHPIVALHYYALFAVFMIYPALLVHCLMSGMFWSLILIQVGVVAVFGVVYRIHVRRLPAEQRVSGFDFLPMALVIPITYAILTPLALFTLDSGKWETRGHELEGATSDSEVPPIATARTAEPFRAHSVAPSAVTPSAVATRADSSALAEEVSAA